LFIFVAIAACATGCGFSIFAANDSANDVLRVAENRPAIYRAYVLVDAVKYWEIIAENLKKAGWSWGCVSAIDREGRTIWIADAHRDHGLRFGNYRPRFIVDLRLSWKVMRSSMFC
jgi:hypothetical protein